MNKNESEVKENKILNFLLKTDRNFLYPTSVVITSIIECHKENQIKIHVLHKDLLDIDIKVLSDFVNKHDMEIFFYKVGSEFFNDFPLKQRYGKEVVYYDLFAHNILPESIKKVIFLGGDAIALCNLAEYYNVNLDNKYMLFCSINFTSESDNLVLGESFENQGAYAPFDSYVLNLDYMREECMSGEKYIKCIQNSKLNPQYADMNLKVELFFPDGKSLFCDARKYDFTICYMMKDDCTFYDINPHIIHYVEIKPWDYWNPNNKSECQLMWNHQRYTNPWIRTIYSKYPFGFDDERVRDCIYEMMKRWWEYASKSPYSVELLNLGDKNKNRIMGMKFQYDLIVEQESIMRMSATDLKIYELEYDTFLNVPFEKLEQICHDYRLRLYATSENDKNSLDCAYIRIKLEKGVMYRIKAIFKLCSNFIGRINLWAGDIKPYQQCLFSTWAESTIKHQMIIDVDNEVMIKENYDRICIPTKYILGPGAYMEFISFKIYKKNK